VSFYRERILPYLVHVSMRQETFAAYRRRVIPAAHGRVLEIGIGSGLNLPFYGEEAKQVIGLDPSASTASSRPSGSTAADSPHRVARTIDTPVSTARKTADIW
jgi:hypothetical protein